MCLVKKGVHRNMNKIFKVVWSKTKECYVVVSEVAKNNSGKKKVLASVLAGLAMAGVGAFGNPALASYDDSGSKINIAPNAKTGNYVGNNSVVVGYENRTDADNNNWGRIIYGANNIAAGASTLALGNENEARGDATTAIGVGSKALDKQSVALGNVARATKQGSVAIGSYVNAETKNSGTTTAPVYNSKDVGQYSTAVGTQSWSKGDYSAAYGYQAEATDTNAVAIGRVSKATGTSATAVGVNNKAQAQDSSAVGSSNTIAAGATQASAFGRENTVNRGGTIAAGYKNTTDGDRNVAIGNENTTTGEETIGIGTKVIAGTGKTIAIGSVYNPGGGVEKQTIARGDDTINPATGQVNNIFALAIGNGAQADGKDNKASGMIAIGQDVVANNNNTIAMGVQAKATGNQAIAFGKIANASGSGAFALGQATNATSHGSIALGNGAQSTGSGSTALGRTAKAANDGTVAVGFSAEATGDGAIAIGGDGKGAAFDNTNTTFAGLGEKTTASAKNAVAVGHQATANIEGGVALGSESKTTKDAGEIGYNPAKDRTNDYKALTNNTKAALTSTRAAVSIGDDSASVTRQLTGLAAGTQDTDAVNVAQLKAVNLKYAGDTGNSDVLLKDGTLNINGDTDTFISTSADANGVKITAKVGENITTNADGKAVAPTTNGIATTDNVTQAINNSGWKVTSSNNGGTTNGSSSEKVSPGDKVTFSAGKNIVLDQAGKQFTYSLNKDVDLTKDGSLTIGDTKINNAGMTITGGPSITKTGIDAGSKKITNVEKGTADTDAVNVKQLKDTEKHIKPDTYAVANDGSVTLKYVDGNGTEQTETAKITGIAKKSKVINGQNTTVEEGTDTADNSITYKVNVKGDLADISSITNGAGSGKISFAGNQVVKVEGDNPISLDGKGGYVTGLQNKDWDITNPTIVSGRAATEDQLKAVDDQVKENKDNITQNTGDIATNKTNIAKNAGDIADNKTAINKNAGDIANNAREIAANKDKIDQNTTAIARNISLGSDDGDTDKKSLSTGDVKFNIKGENGITTAANGVDVTVKLDDATKDKIDNAANKDLSNLTPAGEQQVKDLAAWNVVANNGTAEKVQGGDTVKFIDGDNVSITQNGKEFTVATKKDVTFDNVTANQKITAPEVSGLTNTTWVPGQTAPVSGRAATEDQLKAVDDQVAANKANITKNAGDIKTNKDNIDKNTTAIARKISLGGDTGSTDEKSLSTGDVKFNIKGQNGIVTEANGDDVTVKLDDDTANKINNAANTDLSNLTDAGKQQVKDLSAWNVVANNGTAEKVEGGNTVKFIDGDNISITQNGKDFTIATKKDVTFDTVTANDTITAPKVKATDGVETPEVTGLTNKTWVPGQTQPVSGRAATEDQLKAVDDQVAENKTNIGKNADNIAANKAQIDKNTEAIGRKISLGGNTGSTDKKSLSTGDVKFNIKGENGLTTVANGEDVTVKIDDATKAKIDNAANQDLSNLTDAGKQQVKDLSAWNVTAAGGTVEKVQGGDTVKFQAGDNLEVKQDGTTFTYSLAKDVKGLNSVTVGDENGPSTKITPAGTTVKDAAGNATTVNGAGMTINPANAAASPVSLTVDGLNNGGNQIHGVAPGTADTDAVNVSQLKGAQAGLQEAINRVGVETQRVGAHAAAMAALKPIQYDPLEPTQIMAGIGNYRGETAGAIGLAHYKTEDTMFNIGVTLGSSHNMINAGVTHKFGGSRDRKDAIPERYKAGPISSIYVMQDEVSHLRSQNEEYKSKLEQQQSEIDALKAAVNQLLANKA